MEKIRKENQTIHENPFEFITQFRRSEEYRIAFNTFYEGKELSSTVTEEIKRKAFEKTEAVKAALLTYARDRINFHYNPDYYSVVVNNAVRAYVNLVIQSLNPDLEREEREQLDWQRSALHQELAAALISEGVVDSVILVRAIGRLILIEKGLDTYQSAFEPYLSAVKRKLQ